MPHDTADDSSSVHRADREPAGPGDLVAYRKTRIFDQDDLPDALRTRHSTKEGVWGLIHVVEGRLTYRSFESGLETGIGPDAPRLVRPQEPHAVAPDGDVRFYVEFLKEGGGR